MVPIRCAGDHDPNQLVSVIGQLDATSLPAWETFQTVVPAAYDQVVRGVSFTPGSFDRDH